MAIETTYTHLREKLAVRRRNSRDVALIPATELAALVETAHLLRSPKNAQRLLTALRRAQGQRRKPESLKKLRREMGLGCVRLRG